MISRTTNVLQQGPILCRALIPDSDFTNLYSALVCGTALPAGEEKQLFLDSGLIHLMVVSGAHLIFLESLLTPLPARIRLPLLGFYCWLTGFGPPVVKAFAYRVLETSFKSRGWSRLQTEAASVVLTLCLCPWWLVSRSLQMSWMCSLAMSLPKLVQHSALDQSLKAYVLLFVFAGAPLLSILWNTLVAPFVGVFLFPLSLATLPLPFLAPAADGVWEIFLWILRLGPKGTPHSWFFSSWDLFWIPPLLHLILLVREVRWRRASAFS